MRMFRCSITTATVLLALAFYPVAAAHQLSVRPMTNDDVIRLVKAGMGESVVLTAIEQAVETAFDTSAEALIALKEAGVNDAILAAVLTARTPAPVPEPVVDDAWDTSTTPMDPDGAVVPGIYIELQDDGESQLVPLEPTVISRIRTAGGWATRFTFGIAKNEIVAEVRGAEANLRTTIQQPTFYFYFDVPVSDLSGPFVGWLAAASSPNEFVLLQMYQEHDHREMTIGAANAYGSSTGVESENTVPLTIERLGPGAYRVTPAELLGRGEFCFFYAAGAGTLQATGVVAKLFDFGVH